MKIDEILPYMKQQMSERGSAVFKPQWFPKDDNQDETLEAIIELRDRGVIKANQFFDVIEISKGH